jgi:hypothetical protein
MFSAFCDLLTILFVFQGLVTLVSKLWDLLQVELSSVFSVIERVASECYQISLIVDEAFVNDFSKKIA